jgi:hypothetical protein
MEKSVRKPLYKPQVDSVDINVNVYTNEICGNTTCGNTNCPSGCQTNDGCGCSPANTTFLCW